VGVRLRGAKANLSVMIIAGLAGSLGFKRLLMEERLRLLRPLLKHGVHLGFYYIGGVPAVLPFLSSARPCKNNPM